VVLINAVKDVAKALGDLISATKAAAGNVGDDPAVWQLKNSAKVGENEEQHQEEGN
jgi:talin